MVKNSHGQLLIAQPDIEDQADSTFPATTFYLDLVAYSKPQDEADGLQWQMWPRTASYVSLFVLSVVGVPPNRANSPVSTRPRTGANQNFARRI